MPGPTRSSLLALDRPDHVVRVRDVLDRAGFDERHVRERMATDEMVELRFGMPFSNVPAMSPLPRHDEEF